MDAACWSRMTLIKGTKLKLDQSEFFFLHHFDRIFTERKSQKLGTHIKFLHFRKHQQLLILTVLTCFVGKGRSLKRHVKKTCKTIFWISMWVLFNCVWLPSGKFSKFFRVFLITCQGGREVQLRCDTPKNGSVPTKTPSYLVVWGRIAAASLRRWWGTRLISMSGATWGPKKKPHVGCWLLLPSPSLRREIFQLIWQWHAMFLSCM